MMKPIVREGIRLKPVADGKIVGNKKFNEVQAIAEGLANLMVLVKLDGEIISTQNLKLSGRNSILELDLTGISLTSGMTYRGGWSSTETYNYADVVTTLDTNVGTGEPFSLNRRSWWIWNSQTPGNTATDPNFWNMAVGEDFIGDFLWISSELIDGRPFFTGNVSLPGGLTAEVYNGLIGQIF